MPRLVATICVAIAFLIPTPTFAQAAPGPPGPYVIDIRAPMSGLPSASAFHPAVPADTLVPKRGFGLEIGGHVYPARLGPARIGFGVDFIRARGTASTPPQTVPSGAASSSTSTAAVSAAGGLSAFGQIDIATTLTIVAPQVSFNFGSRDGWSYLSGGYGTARLRSAASGQPTAPLAGAVTTVRDDGRAGAVNYGGGARWFIRQRIAIGFDLRFHRIAAAGTRPTTRVTTVSAGLALR